MRDNPAGTTGLFVSELALGTTTFGASGRSDVIDSVDRTGANRIVA